MVAQRRVLVLDDEIDICNMLSDYLTSQSYDVRFCTEVDDFLETINKYMPQFIIMDKFVHKHDCVSLIDKIRKNDASRDLPILLITGCTDFDEKLRAIEIGADDVLIKPLNLAEVKAKLQSLARRSATYQLPTEAVTYKSLTIHPESGEVVTNESQHIVLTETEFKIFHLLVVSKGNVVVREQLVHKTLTARNNNLRTIDVHINSLRGKLGDLGNKIKTLRGRGYMLID